MVLTPRCWRQVRGVASAQPGLDKNISAGRRWQKSPDTRARRKPLKPLRAGTPGDSGVLVVTRVRSTTTSAHEAAGATGIRRSPRPLRAEDSSNASGAWRREVASVCLESRCRHSSCPGKSAKRVFALDDPGIHQSSQDRFRRRWIAGSSPAMTALQRIAFGCLKIESIVALATRTVCSLPPCGGELERGVATSTNLVAYPPP